MPLALLNPFQANVPFLCPLENIRKTPVFRCFQGVQKWNVGLTWAKPGFPIAHMERQLIFIKAKT